jgi:LysM repeat protein
VRSVKVIFCVCLWALFFELCTGQAFAAEPAYWGYRVNSGDTLWLLARRYGTTVAEIQALNRIGPNLTPGQFLYLPVKQEGQGIVYRVQPGDTLYLISVRHGREVESIRRLSGLTQDLIHPGQSLLIPLAATGYFAYRVAAGDTLYLLARRFGCTVDGIRQANRLASDELLVGQLLQIPAERSPSASRGGSSTVVLHRVTPGETLATLAQTYRTTVAAIYQTNRLNSEILMPGQPLYIPVGSPNPVAVEGPRGEQVPGYGELLDWEWARWIYNPGAVATVTDFYTGKRFQVRHLGGSNHADSEPLTREDTAVMKDLFGGQWSWAKRPVWVEVAGRLLAASISGMPHDAQTIRDNDFPGHFDVYFYNSRSHNTDSINPEHQKNVLIAAGRL